MIKPSLLAASFYEGLPRNPDALRLLKHTKKPSFIERSQRLQQLDVGESAKAIWRQMKRTPEPFVQVGGSLLGWLDLIFFQKLPLFYVANTAANASYFSYMARGLRDSYQAGNPAKEGVGKLWQYNPAYHQLPRPLQRDGWGQGQPSYLLPQAAALSLSSAVILTPNSLLGEIGRISQVGFGGWFSAALENQYRLQDMKKQGRLDPLAHFGEVYQLATLGFYKRGFQGKWTPEDKRHLATFWRVQALDFKRSLRQSAALLLPIAFHPPQIRKPNEAINYLKVASAFDVRGFKAWKQSWKEALNTDLNHHSEGSDMGKYALRSLSSVGYAAVGILGVAYPILEAKGKAERKQPAGFNPYGRSESSQGETQSNLPPSTASLWGERLRHACDITMGVSRVIYYLGGMLLFWKNRNLLQFAISGLKVGLGFGYSERWAYWKNNLLNALLNFEVQTLNQKKRSLLVYKPPQVKGTI